MNAFNAALTALFDLLLKPLELVGPGFALILVSGVFGVLALFVFKFISFQKAIKRTKDLIKGHMIEIRLYQDDLVIVAKAFAKIMLRNLQYIGLNFGPFVPLAIPFALVLAQFVVRYAFAPVPVHAPDAAMLPGSGTMLRVEFTPGNEALVKGLSIEYPAGVVPRSPLVRPKSEGRAFQEILAVEPGVHEIAFVLPDGTRETKILVAGKEPGRHMQPYRGRGFLDALLWPAEPTFSKSSPFAAVEFDYPDRDLGWLPGGVVGILVVFLVSSMLFGFLALKPLKVQI